MNTYDLAPIVLFVYNRPVHTHRTIESLKNNRLASQSDLIIFSDAAKNKDAENSVKQVREYIKKISGFKSIRIIERQENWGLAKSIIDGVTSVINKYGKIIVLEDDLVTSPFFLIFVNEALNVYQNNLMVSQIVGYSYFEKYLKEYQLDDTLFIRGADCLGWGTWKDRWSHFNENSAELIKQFNTRKLKYDFNIRGAYDYYSMLKMESQGEIGSWAIRWYASAFLKNLYTLYPSRSLVLHIGNDELGTNYRVKNDNDPLIVPLFMEKIIIGKMDVIQSENAINAYRDFLLQYQKFGLKSLFFRIKNIFLRGLL